MPLRPVKTINERWKEFESLVIAKDAPKVQRVESKRMFFAGFAAAFDAITGPDIVDMPEDDGCAQLESLRKQLLGFNEAVKMGAE